MMENITAKDIENKFREKLSALLREYDAELEVVENDMHIWIDGKWDSDGNCTSPYTSFSLGKLVTGG